NGKRNDRTNPLYPEPSWSSKTLAVLGMPTGEGVEGVGSSIERGQGEVFPLWVWAKPMIFFHACHGSTVVEMYVFTQ
ncbi:hypothetical protein CN448_23200, partial [Bacillus cereus]